MRIRHNLLEGAIGTFKEEKEAYHIVTLLSWLLPTIVATGALLDMFFVFIYMTFAHPWIEILSEETQPKEDNANELVSEILEDRPA